MYESRRDYYHHSATRCSLIFIQIGEENNCNMVWFGRGRQGENLPAHHSSTPYTTSSSQLGDSLRNPAVILLILFKHSSETPRKGPDLKACTRNCDLEAIWNTICKELAKQLRTAISVYIANISEFFWKLTLELWLLPGCQWIQSESLHLW